MLITEGKVAIILILLTKRIKLTPAEYSGILVGVRGKITIECDRSGLEGVG
ncbi:MAG: hypothetical protein ACFCU7_12525 [Pleurocapsa sp.]